MAKLLNKKHELFCNEYLVDLNSTQSYLRVGYKVSDEIARRNGSRLLTKVDVQDRIAELMQERAKRTEITQDKVLQELAHIAFDDIKNYLSFRTEKTQVSESDGIPIFAYDTIINLKDSDTIDTRNIAEVQKGKDGQFKFKLYCKDNALVQLGRHLGMFEKDKDVEKEMLDKLDKILEEQQNAKVD